MGSVLIAACVCGYRSKELVEGTGELMPPPRVPAACPACRFVASVVDDERARCPRCRGPVKKFWSHDDPEPVKVREPWDEPEPEVGDQRLAATYKCPRCETERLQFELVALWD